MRRLTNACEVSSNQLVGMTTSHTLTCFFSRCFYEKSWALFPKPSIFKAAKHEKVFMMGEEKERTPNYKCRGLRWSGVKPQEEEKALSKVIDVKESYNFRPYSYKPRRVPTFYLKQS